jgi:hypothetical protein
VSSSRNQTKAFLAAVVGAAILAAVVYWPEHRLRAAATASVGLSEAEVVARLGAPHAVITAAEARTSANWWGANWHPAPDRPVVNKVLLYYASFTGALIYLDPSGNVVHVHVMGT